MPIAAANGIQIEYDTFGDSTDSPILLITGLGGQMIVWDEALCRRLAEDGLYVVRFDNRDSGLSTKFDQAGTPDLVAGLAALARGEMPEAAYTLDDMADDAVGLLDALGIERAYLCGISMGAAIAQTITIRHPGRVLGLISIYGTTGNPVLPTLEPHIIELLVAPTPRDRQGAIDHKMKLFRTIAGSGFPFDEQGHRAYAERSFDRSFCPEGASRQLQGIWAHGNRKPALTKVTVPTLVIHGTDDPLVLVEGGYDTAEAVPGAELMIIEGMGHDIPCCYNAEGPWPRIAGAILRFCRQWPPAGISK